MLLRRSHVPFRARPDRRPAVLIRRPTGATQNHYSEAGRIQEVLRRASLLSLVDAIVGGEDVSAHKPNPAGLVAALATLKTPAARAIYVGDHPVDALAAQAAGVRFVGVLTGTTDRDEFAEVGVSDVLRSVEDLPSHVATRRLTEDSSPQQ